MRRGYGIRRRRVMHNDFVIVGPKADPARIKRASTSAQAFEADPIPSARQLPRVVTKTS